MVFDCFVTIDHLVVVDLVAALGDILWNFKEYCVGSQDKSETQPDVNEEGFLTRNDYKRDEYR